MKSTLLSPRARWTVDFWLGELRASWSITETRARVVEVIDETADAKSFVLATGRSWPGHRAGQYVPVEVEIDGVRVRRCYSISSGASRAGAGRIAITVKRVPGGRVSSCMHARLVAGSILRLGLPAGDFVVDDAGASRKLLLVGGGSGITPIMAIVRELALRDRPIDAVVVHVARSFDDAIFAKQLAAYNATIPGLRVSAHRGRLTPESLHVEVPDLAERQAYVCGPAGLLDLVVEVCGEHARLERFVAAAPRNERRVEPAAPTIARSIVHLAQLGRSHVVGDGTLLDELERAGERPAHGCRMGICNSCRCTKTSGTVEDIVTGALSSEPDQEIRLCVSIARSDIELAV